MGNEIVERCACDCPQFCELRHQWVGKTAIRICRSRDSHRIRRYFYPKLLTLEKPLRERPKTRRGTLAAHGRTKALPERAPCFFLGESVRDHDGRAVTKQCSPCAAERGLADYRLKVHACKSPDRVATPTTTADFCQVCPFWEPAQG